jgi:hypothetical protein
VRFEYNNAIDKSMERPEFVSVFLLASELLVCCGSSICGHSFIIQERAIKSKMRKQNNLSARMLLTVDQLEAARHELLAFCGEFIHGDSKTNDVSA